MPDSLPLSPHGRASRRVGVQAGRGPFVSGRRPHKRLNASDFLVINGDTEPGAQIAPGELQCLRKHSFPFPNESEEMSPQR